MFEFIVSIQPAAHDRMDAIVQALREAGLQDVEVRARFGLVVGAATLDAVPRLEAVDGVKSVRRGATYTAQAASAG